MRITGTFLDEITHDIPSNNWGHEEWAKDFEIMKAIGIDTVILIRAGCGRIAAFPSKVLQREVNIYPVYEDLVDMFLFLSEENEVDFFFGTYDSVTYASRERSIPEHLGLGRAFIDEVWERYGHHKAFKGWYLTFEIARKEPTRLECLRQLGRHCKELSPQLPILISPYIAGDKLVSNPVTLEEHYADWDNILTVLENIVDIVAFQDGQVDYDVLPDFLQDYLPFFFKFDRIKRRVQNHVDLHLDHGGKRGTWTDYRISGEIVGGKGVVLSSKSIQFAVYLPWTPGGGPLENQMFYKMGCTPYVISFISASGGNPDVHSYQFIGMVFVHDKGNTPRQDPFLGRGLRWGPGGVL